MNGVGYVLRRKVFASLEGTEGIGQKAEEAECGTVIVTNVPSQCKRLAVGEV